METIKLSNQLRVVVIAIAMITILYFSGCTNQSITQPSPLPVNTPEIKETSTFLATEPLLLTSTIPPLPVQTQEPAAIDRTVYTFNADLDYNKHSLVVRQTIQYQNNTGQALNEIKLAVPPNEKNNVFVLNSLILSGDAVMADYSLDGITLTIELNSPLPVAGIIIIDLDYVLTPRLQGGVLGYSARQLNLSDWYPFIPPYDSVSGWIIHQPAAVGENLVYETADFDLTLNLTDSKGIKVAGSTEVQPLDLDSFRMIQENSRGITLSLSDQYSLLTNTSNGITVKGYVFAGDEIAGQAAVDYTASALQLYSELFGVQYPHQTMSVVESDFPDGMEYDGLYYLSDFYYKNYDGTFQNYLALLSVHETSHQWWFGSVANDQAIEPWLDESLAAYSEFIYIERYYPELINWWWDYRINYYKPDGRVNLSIYDQSDLRNYINAVYLQGATFLDQLRQALGDDVFFNGLKTYANTYNQKIASWDGFIKIMAPDPSDEVKAILTKYFN